jgi:N-acetylmuramoyl-L-alanine amidase
MDTPYPAAQIAALRALLGELERRLPSLEWIAGHEDLDPESVPAEDDPALKVRRKRDPGPLFPWPEVLAGSRLQRRPGTVSEQ